MKSLKQPREDKISANIIQIGEAPIKGGTIQAALKQYLEQRARLFGLGAPILASTEEPTYQDGWHNCRDDFNIKPPPDEPVGISAADQACETMTVFRVDTLRLSSNPS